ncbi:hypothetical protein Hanom_Chr01g00069991 [Helianthus anomalus]
MRVIMFFTALQSEIERDIEVKHGGWRRRTTAYGGSWQRHLRLPPPPPSVFF